LDGDVPAAEVQSKKKKPKSTGRKRGKKGGGGERPGLLAALLCFFSLAAAGAEGAVGEPLTLRGKKGKKRLRWCSRIYFVVRDVTRLEPDANFGWKAEKGKGEEKKKKKGR